MGTFRFNAWQIELTTRCPLRCTMCIKDRYRDWHRRDMAMEDFLKIVPYLRYVHTAVLEGWGESLMHPHLLDIIGLVKKQGCEVGFVTSGYGLDEDLIIKLIEAGIDFIGFSISGATDKTHNSIRVNSDFYNLVGSIKAFNTCIAENNLKKPKIHIVYLMLTENILEMPAVIRLAADTGVKEVVFINITHITNDRQDREKVFICQVHEEQPYRGIIDETIKAAKRLKIKINLPGMTAGDVALCSENPLENLYISSEGEVSPCVYLYPPIPDDFKRIFCGKEHTVNKVSFGNIFNEDMETIWNKKGYLDFRGRFYERKKKMEELYNLILEPKRIRDMTLPEPPEPCKTCHKILGV